MSGTHEFQEWPKMGRYFRDIIVTEKIDGTNAQVLITEDEVIAGSRMPNLMYMTAFESKKDRDAHWAAFDSDPDWKHLSSLPEYKNNMSHSDITFLRPADYSDF